LPARVAQLVEYPIAALEEQAPSLRQTQRPRRPLKKTKPELAFQQGDALAHSRSRDTQRLAGARDAAKFRYSDQGEDAAATSTAIVGSINIA